MIRFLLFLAYSTVVFFLPNNLCLLFLLLANLAVFFLAHHFARVELKKVLAGTLRFVPFIILMYLFNLWLDQPLNALWIAYKLLIVCNMTMIYAGTTSNLEIANIIMRLCAPLRFFHVNTEDIRILVCISLSLIPTLRRQLTETRLACAAKGLSFSVRNSKIVLARFFTTVFSRIDEIEASLLAKGYRE